MATIKYFSRHTHLLWLSYAAWTFLSGPLAYAADVDFSYTANPFDALGPIHNDNLDYLSANKDRLRKEPALLALQAAQLITEHACTERKNNVWTF